MKEKFNLDIVLINLNDIIESTKSCITNLSKQYYTEEYKNNLISLIDILDSVDLIEKEVSNYYTKRELE